MAAYRARENQILHIYNVLLRMSAVTLETCRGAWYDRYYCWIKKIVHQVGCKISILYRDARSKIHQIAMFVNLTYVQYEAKIHWQRTEFWNTVWRFLRNIFIFQHLLAPLKIISWPTRYEVGRVSAVGIAARYGMDGTEIESRWGGEIFCTRRDRSWGPPCLL
jgi:hypothetical protein